MTNPQDYSIASKCSEGGKKEWDRIKDDINLEYLFKCSRENKSTRGINAIQAFLLCMNQYHATENLNIPAWVLIELAKAFQDYWYDNLDGKKCTIDEKLGINGRTFQQIKTNQKEKELAENVYNFKWAFGLDNKQAVMAVIEAKLVDINTKENEIERIYERSKLSGYYQTFVDKVKHTDKPSYAKSLLESLPLAAQKFIKSEIRYNNAPSK